MNNRLDYPILKQNHWVLAFCPKTGEEVVGSSWHKSLLSLEAVPTWYYCPACKSWHVQISKPQSQKRH